MKGTGGDIVVDIEEQPVQVDPGSSARVLRTCASIGAMGVLAFLVVALSAGYKDFSQGAVSAPDQAGDTGVRALTGAAASSRLPLPRDQRVLAEKPSAKAGKAKPSPSPATPEGQRVRSAVATEILSDEQLKEVFDLLNAKYSSSEVVTKSIIAKLCGKDFSCTDAEWENVRKVNGYLNPPQGANVIGELAKGVDAARSSADPQAISDIKNRITSVIDNALIELSIVPRPPVPVPFPPVAPPVAVPVAVPVKAPVVLPVAVPPSSPPMIVPAAPKGHENTPTRADGTLSTTSSPTRTTTRSPEGDSNPAEARPQAEDSMGARILNWFRNFPESRERDIPIAAGSGVVGVAILALIATCVVKRCRSPREEVDRVVHQI